MIKDLEALANGMENQLAAAKTAQLTADGDIVIKPHGKRRNVKTYEGELLKLRVRNVEDYATKYNNVNDMENDNVAELVIFGPNSYYMYSTNSNEGDASTDQDGNVEKATDWTSWIEDTNNYTLLEPKCAEQTWHFDVTLSTLGKDSHNGDKQKLAEALMTQFSEAFKSMTIYGSLGNYLDYLRLLKALRLLKTHPNYNVEAVAKEAGFASVRTLNRKIQDVVGMTPRQFRDMCTIDGTE